MLGKLNLKKRSEGFTIIEVLIVLAIVGLIMVIVFIAVPALQRAQRNEARNNDARLIANAINECLVNRGGNPENCNTHAPGANEVLLPANLHTVTTAEHTTAGNPTGSLTSAQWTFGRRCNPDNPSGPLVSGSHREFAVRWLNEATGATGGTVQRCISG